MARPQRPHKCSWDDKLIQGLYRCPDGRWRINATGKKFSEPDERRAVARFLAMQPAPETVDMEVATNGETHDAARAFSNAATFKAEIVLTAPLDHREPRKVTRKVLSADYWAQVRSDLIDRPEYVARMTGLPNVATFRYADLPRQPIKIKELIEAYEQQNPSTAKTKTRCVTIFNRLVAHTNARTIDDLSQDGLASFRKSIEASADITSAGTKTWMYGQVKSVLSFGLKCGLDQQQIRACLDRCKVLWTPDAPPAVQPKPISREDFHKLLTAAGAGSWRAWLLLGLNAALYLEEICSTRWTEIDLERGVYATIRNKTKRERVPRAATLWTETIAAIRQLRRGPEYVFTSPHGTRYGSSNSRANAFAELRERAGVASSIGFASLKDAAYTIAVQNSPDERLARVLAGHRSPGLQDNYVLRHPELVRPACDCVYKAFGPF